MQNKIKHHTKHQIYVENPSNMKGKNHGANSESNPLILKRLQFFSGFLPKIRKHFELKNNNWCGVQEGSHQRVVALPCSQNLLSDSSVSTSWGCAGFLPSLGFSGSLSGGTRLSPNLKFSIHCIFSVGFSFSAWSHLKNGIPVFFSSRVPYPHNHIP